MLAIIKFDNPVVCFSNRSFPVNKSPNHQQTQICNIGPCRRKKQTKKPETTIPHWNRVARTKTSQSFPFLSLRQRHPRSGPTNERLKIRHQNHLRPNRPSEILVKQADLDGSSKRKNRLLMNPRYAFDLYT
jgi:hypothetical protein